MTLLIRNAAPKDEAAWRGLWTDYLRFYKVDLAPQVTDLTWSRILDPTSRLKARVAEVASTVHGFAVWHRHVASWSAQDDCYLEDLFVADSARGAGLGRALLDDLIVVARDAGCGRFYWHTDQDNARARALYDSYAQQDGHVRYRFTL